jgi:O-antigen/teichoic acid export membrane protein
MSAVPLENLKEAQPAKSLRAKVRSGLIWSAVQSWGGRLAVLALFMVVARVLTPNEIGLFAMASVVMYLLTMLADQGLVEAVVQRPDVTPEQMNTVFFFNLGLALVMMSAMWIAAPWVAAWFKAPEGANLLRVLSLALPLSAANLGQSAMRKRAFEYRWLAITHLASTLIGTVAALALILMGFGVWALVLQWLLATALLTTMFWLKPSWRLSRKTDFRGSLPLFRYGLNRISAAILDFLNTRYIDFFLAATLGPVVLAVYTVGVRFQQALMQALGSVAYEIAHNGFSRLADDRPALVAAYDKSMMATAAVMVPVFCLVAAVAAPLTTVFFGERWMDSVVVTRVVCVVAAIQLLQMYNGTLLNAIGLPSISLQFTIARLLLTVAAFELVRGRDLDTLLVAYFISQLITVPISFWVVKHRVGVSLRQIARLVWPFMAASVLMSAAAYATAVLMGRLPAFVVLVASTAVGGMVYAGFIRLVSPDAFGRAIAAVRARH